MATTYLRPFKVRGLALCNNLAQAPLAGFSSAPMRLLAQRWGKPGLCFTEMISATALAQNPEAQRRYLLLYPGEGPVAFQLWGREPQILAEATRIAADHGASAIDLNCGCPVRKILAAGAGVKLMEDSALIGKIVASMRQRTELPISIKIRLGPSPERTNAVEIARIAGEEGIDFISVHGRYGGESYGAPCRYERLAEVVAAARVPVFGNGDVRDGASAEAMFVKTGCAGVMIGRAALGAPWIFAKIAAGLLDAEYGPPPPPVIGQIFLEHHDLLASMINGLAILQCRKIGCFYSKGLAGGKELRIRLNHCRSREDLRLLVERYFR